MDKKSESIRTEFRSLLIDYVIQLLKQKNTSPEMAATILGLVQYLKI